MVIRQIQRQASEFRQPVDETDLLRRLAQQLEGEEIVDVVELQAGLFNSSYRVATSRATYILKVAPRGDADVFYNEKHLMQRERSIAARLQSVDRLVPQYLSFFTVDGRDAFLQPFVPGRPWNEAISTLSQTENASLWSQLGAFARKLHACRGEYFGYPAPARGFSRWSRFIADNVEGLVEDCRRHGILCAEIEEYAARLPHYSGILDRVKTANLVHGDLWPSNVIIGGEGGEIHLKAVIDGERAFWGDPLSDWVLLLYGVPAAFWRGYGENLLETGDPVRISVYRGMYYIVNILEATRFDDSDEVPRKRLSAINRALKEMQST